MTLNLAVGKHYRIPTERLSGEDLPVTYNVVPRPSGLNVDQDTGLVTGVVTEPPTPIPPSLVGFWRDRLITFVVS